MSMYQQFQTDKQMEVGGIIVDYGDFRVTLARAGGGNKSYTRKLEALSKPHKRAIQAGALDPATASTIMRTALIQGCIKKWEVRVADDKGKNGFAWKQGIHAPDGSVLPFNEDNLDRALRDLEDLMLDLNQQASNAALYRIEQLEEDVGN